MATSGLTSSISDPVTRGGVSSRAPFPPDPRAFDFSFAFNNPEFSDRVLVLEILEDAKEETSLEKAAPQSPSARLQQKEPEVYPRLHHHAHHQQQQQQHQTLQQQKQQQQQSFPEPTPVDHSKHTQPQHQQQATEATPHSNQEPPSSSSSSPPSSSSSPSTSSSSSSPSPSSCPSSSSSSRPGYTPAGVSHSAAGVTHVSAAGVLSAAESPPRPKACLIRTGEDLQRISLDASTPDRDQEASRMPGGGGALLDGGQWQRLGDHGNVQEASSGDKSISGCGWRKGREEQSRQAELHVISALLVSQSEFFRSLFSPEWSSVASGNSKGAPSVTLKLSSEEEKPFLELMRFIYTGRLNTEEEPEDVLQLLLVANKYGVLSCVNVCAHQLREVPLSLEICCILLRVCSGVVLSEAASFLVASSASFLVSRFGNLDAMWKSQEFLDLPLEALEAVLGSDDVCVMSEETVFSAMLHWVRHQCPEDLAARKELVARLAEKVRFAAMDADVLQYTVMTAPETELPTVKSLVMEALWFKCSSFERQQELVLSSIRQHRRFLRRRQLSIHSEVLLQDCYMLQPAQAILLPGGAWVCNKLFSLKVMRVAAPVGGSDFGLFLQASQRSPSQDKVLDDSVSVEFSFKVKEWPAGVYVQQKQSASHTFKGLFRERGYRSLLSPWNEVMKDNNKYFRNGIMYIRADLRVIQPGESLGPFE